MIASDIWCFRAIAAIGSLPRMTSITISYRFSAVQRLGLGIVPRPARMNWSPPPRCGRAAEASLKNAALLQLFHNVLVEIELHLSLLCALNRSNSKTVPNFVGRDKATKNAAHQLARIFYHLLKTRQPYDETVFAKLEARNQKRRLHKLQTLARQMGYSLVQANA